MAAPYPPPHHLLSDLGLEIDRSDGALRVRLPVTAHLLDAEGAVRAGVLGVALDVFAGNLAVEAARPHWALTSELSLHRLRPATGGVLEVTGQALRAGRTQLVVEAEVRAPNSADPIALGQIAFTRVPRRADTPESPSDPPDVYTFGTAGPSLSAPLLEALGFTAVDVRGGVLELPLRPYLRNSVGGLQGGAVVTFAEASATVAASERLGGAALVDDLETRFLALGREGPVTSRATLVRQAGARALLRVELRDAGQEDRLVAVAMAHARR